MNNSPTQTVGYAVVGGLEKTTHPIPLLSLEKTKEIDDLVQFAGDRQMLLMLKLDGLTVKLEYEGEILVRASTRGDGEVGDVITHNARAIAGIPDKIPYKERLVVTGEAHILSSDFERLKETLLDSNGKRYRNARNLAAGSVRQLDAAACAQRAVRFIPFGVLEGLDDDPQLANSKLERLEYLHRELGFARCPCYLTRNFTAAGMELVIDKLKGQAGALPIDGMVLTFDDVAFSRAQGRTGHHYKDGIAFKFEDDLFETVLQEIEWTPTRDGGISAVAIFETVEIDGCEVSRATLHNLTIIRELELMPGCRILVSKRGAIIPHVEGNLDMGRYQAEAVIPAACPCCGAPTRIQKGEPDKDGRVIETLHCDNPACDIRRLRQFGHFVGKKAMDIEGLSEATLEKFIGRGWLHSFMDIYRLDRHADEICRMEGFGPKSWRRLWDSIQRSRDTSFERYLIAMDIPMIGRSASKELSRVFSGDLEAFESAVDGGYNFTQLNDFGETLHCNIHEWFRVEENRHLWEELQKMLNIEKRENLETTAPATDNPFRGLTIVVTGKVEPYTRSGINAMIESLGAKAGSSVSKNTDYLVCGENAGSKLSKARQLGVTVLTPAEFFHMAGA